MLPSTIQRIDHAIAESPCTLTPDPRRELLEFAVGATVRAQSSRTPTEVHRHTLRAIAYLVRWLELDAPEGT